MNEEVSSPPFSHARSILINEIEQTHPAYMETG